MIRSLRSELLKLQRRGVLIGGGGITLAFAVLATVLTFTSATATAAAEADFRPTKTTLSVLSSPGGATRGFEGATAFIGLVVFVLFITSFAGEYGYGTWRALLTRQPRRFQLLAGKFVALAAAAAAALAIAELVSIITAYAMAPSQGVTTSEWFRSTGLQRAVGDYANAVLAAVAWGALGAAVAVLVRSIPAALGLGLAWVVPFEHVLSDGWKAGSHWLPGLLLEGFVVGGTPDASYRRSLLLIGLYATASFAIASLAFTRRDVSG